MASFSVTQGPKADVAELEYIAALHQTCPATTRPTGTISSLDVARYLKSRLGLEISQTHARDIILALGGGSLPTDLRRQIAQRVAHESSAAAAAASTQSSTPKSRRQRWKEARSTHKASPLSVVDDETNEVEQAKLQTRTQQLIQELLAPKILYLDIVQMTSILLIPTFCRIQHDNELLKEEKASNPTNVKEGQTGEEKEVESWPANPATQSQNKSDNQDDDLSPQPSDLMEVVLQNLWAVGSGGREEDASVSSPPKLTPSLLKSFLEEVGEMERSNQTDLLQRMIQVAGGDGVVLDKATLLRALTADLQDWRVGCEDEESTYVQDVLGVDDPTALHSSFVRLGDANISGNRGKEPWNKQSTWKNEEDKSNIDLYVEDEEAGKGDLKQPELKEIGNVESDDKPDIQGKNDEDEDIVPVANMAMKGFVVVDQVIDVSASNVTLLLAWVTFIGHAGTWAPLILSLDPIQVECPASTFGCVLGGTIMNWVIVALTLVIFGFLVLVPILYGNHPTRRGPTRMFLATLATLSVTFLPIVIALPFQPFENTDIEEEPAFNGTILMTSITGSILAAKYFVQALIALGKGYGYHFEPGGFIDTYFNKTSTMIGDARLKQAATRKVNTLLVNARSMHGSAQSVYNADSLRKSQSDTVFQNYTLKGESKAKIGNIFWVAERILTGELFDTEGIWLPSRLLIFQAGQITFSCFILFYLFIVVERAADAADEASKNLNPALPSWYIDFVPTGAQVRKALMPAAIISVGVCFCLVLIYIPSSVKTILQFRCGQLRALGDANFQLAREGPDLAYMNTANAIYGTVAAAGLFFFLIGLALFLFVWEFSRGIMLIVIAWGIGLSVTILVKSLLTSLCRKRFFRAFYRVQPGLSNIASLALECWFIGLGGGVLVGRITQFLLASAFWIGRIDEPFLADNISLMGYKFDYVPLNYIKELLVHEAHRHPYLERLSCMYLMRLRYKTFANSDACGAWRQLFVLTLLPWLLKYRVSEEQRCIESLKDQDSEREVEADEDKDAVEATTEEIWGAAFGIGTEGAKTIGEVGLGIVDVGQVGVGVAVDKLRFWKKNTENKK